MPKGSTVECAIECEGKQDRLADRGGGSPESLARRAPRRGPPKQRMMQSPKKQWSWKMDDQYDAWKLLLAGRADHFIGGREA
jgi:hypothetical protein